MKIAGVTVLYNPSNEVKNNIKSYINEIDILYLVDNTPNIDNSNLFKNVKKVKYIPLKDNKGIAYALNVGAKEAMKSGADWLLTMDQDSHFEKGNLKKLISFLGDIKKGKYSDLDFDKVGLVSPFHEIPQTEGQNPKGYDKPLLVMTSGNIINLKAYEKIGGFKDWLFIDTVDFDYCLNLRTHGYEIVQDNESHLKHNLGNTIKKTIGKKSMFVSNHSAIRRYYMVRNRHYIYDMYHEQFPLYCKLEIGRTRRELFKLWLYEKQKIKKTIYMFQGYIDYKRGRKGSKK